MSNAQRIRLAGWCGIAGGLLYFLHAVFGELVSDPTPGSAGFMAGAAGATANFVVLLVGLLGILWGGALGGRPGTIVFGIAVSGYGLMIVGAVLTMLGLGPLTDPVQAVSLVYLLGRLIAVLFTICTGVAVLAARRWQGWTRFAPLMLGLWPLLGEAAYAALTGATPNAIVNGMWGVFGALLGLATLAQLRSARMIEQTA